MVYSSVGIIPFPMFFSLNFVFLRFSYYICTACVVSHSGACAPRRSSRIWRRTWMGNFRYKNKRRYSRLVFDYLKRRTLQNVYMMTMQR